MEGLMYYLKWVNSLADRGPDGVTGFVRDFLKLKDETQRYKDENIYPTAAGDRAENRKKNRYKDILPYDYCRVDLLSIDNVPGSDYINASYIKGPFDKQSYIAAQGPLPHTVNDYWRMLLDINAQTVVMVCREVEHGKHKCERYWPDVGQEKKYGDISVSLLSQDRISDGFLVRKMKAMLRNRELTVTQYHYTSWPDHGTPEDVNTLLNLIDKIREMHHDHSSVPVVVHCSAGCGRTGVVLAVDYARGLLNSGNIPNNFNMYDIIWAMRKQRNAIVQTKDQYVFVCKTVSELVIRLLKQKQATKKETEWIRKNSMIMFPETNTSESSDEEAVPASRKQPVKTSYSNKPAPAIPVTASASNNGASVPPPTKLNHPYVNLVIHQSDSSPQLQMGTIVEDRPPLPARRTSTKVTPERRPPTDETAGVVRKGSVSAKSQWFDGLSSGAKPPGGEAAGTCGAETVRGGNDDPPPVHPKMKKVTDPKVAVSLPVKITKITSDPPPKLLMTPATPEVHVAPAPQTSVGSRQTTSNQSASSAPGRSKAGKVSPAPEGPVQLRHRRYENLDPTQLLKPVRAEAAPRGGLDRGPAPNTSYILKSKTHPPSPPVLTDKKRFALGTFADGKASYSINQHAPVEHHVKQVHLHQAVPHRAVIGAESKTGAPPTQPPQRKISPPLYAIPYETIFPVEDQASAAPKQSLVTPTPAKSRSLETPSRAAPVASEAMSFYAVTDVTQKGAARACRDRSHPDLHRNDDHLIRGSDSDYDYAFPSRLFDTKPPVPDRSELNCGGQQRHVRQVPDYEEILFDGVPDDNTEIGKSGDGVDKRTSNSIFYVSPKTVDDCELRLSASNDVLEHLYAQPLKRRGSLDSQTVQRVRRNSSIEYSVIPPQVPQRTAESFEFVDNEQNDFKKPPKHFYRSMRTKFGAKLQFLHNVLPLEFPKRLGLKPKGPREPTFVKR